MTIKKELKKLETKGKALQREIEVKGKALQKELESKGRELQDKVEAKGRRFQEKINSSRKTATSPLKERNAIPLKVELPLPPPEPMRTELTDALMRRDSGRTFSDETISDQMLSNILWAVDGTNKGSDGRTTPSPLGWHGMHVYVVKANGVWLWLPERTALAFVRGGDQRGEVASVDVLAARAPVQLVYVADLTGKALKALESTDEFLSRVNSPATKRIGAWARNSIRSAVTLDAGSKIMACHLACAAMGLATTSRIALDHRRTADALLLAPLHVVVAAQTVGYGIFRQPAPTDAGSGEARAKSATAAGQRPEMKKHS